MIVVLSLLFAEQAFAVLFNNGEDILKSEKMGKYFNSFTMFDFMYRLGIEQDRKLGLQKDCTSRYFVRPEGLSVVSPIDFPEDRQNPVKGVWIFRYTLTRCEETKSYNAMFIADESGGIPKAQAYFPGTSAANALLIYDAMPMAVTTAKIRSGSTDTNDVQVFDMRVDAPKHDVEEGGKVIKGVWTEIWTFKVSDKLVEVPVKFIPDSDGGGTTFTIGVNAGNIPDIHR